METKGAQHQDSIRWRKQPNTRTLLLGAGVFLCVTTSLTLVIILCNFSMTYQTRNFLFQMYSKEPKPFIPFTEPTASSSPSTLPTTIFITTTDTPPSSDSTGFKTTHSAPTSLYTSTPSVTDYNTSPVTSNKENPINILEVEGGLKKTYTCAQRCTSPSIFSAQLNITLSADRKNDNYMLLTATVSTNDTRVAKRRVAYVALSFLYKDRLNESTVDPDWGNDVPPESECEVRGNNTWGKCK